MAVALANQYSADNTNVQTTSATVTGVTAAVGQFISIWVFTIPATANSTVTDASGNTYTRQLVDSSVAYKVALHTTPVTVALSSATITVAHTSNALSYTAVQVWSGVLSIAQISNISSFTGSGPYTYNLPKVTPTNTGNQIIGGMTIGTTASPTATPSGYTELEALFAGNGRAVWAYRTPPDTSLQGPAWTFAALSNAGTVSALLVGSASASPAASSAQLLFH